MNDEPIHRASWRNRTFALLAVLVVTAGGFLVWQNFFQTYHFVVVDPGKVYRDGNRSVREFKNALRKSSPRTIVVIIDDEEYNQPEFVEARNLAANRGMGYHWIKIKAGAYPTPAQVREFLAIATDPSKQPILYHDDEGIRRAGMMMAAYQMSAMGFDRTRAKSSIQAFGHSDRTIKDVVRFIDAYDPAAGLSQDLNESAATLPTTASTTQP